MVLDGSVPAHSLAQAVVMRVLVPLMTMVTIGAAALLVLFTPLYLHPALDASDAPAWLGMSSEETHSYSDKTISDLIFGPGTFDFAAPDGSTFYDPAERGHMRDVRIVLFAFLGLAALSAVVLAVAAARRRGDRSFVAGVGRGGAWLAVGTLVVGVFAALAFDTAFETFHELLFPGGNFSFDPTKERLVQLYPIAFWELTSAVLGGLLIVAGALTWFVARRRLAGTAQ
jgi:integral membrane protein (TIGR01906 family)